MTDVYELTLKRENDLRALGYNLVTIWECEWSKMKSDRDDVYPPLSNLAMPSKEDAPTPPDSITKWMQAPGRKYATTITPACTLGSTNVANTP